jgi:hypothetical protein
MSRRGACRQPESSERLKSKDRKAGTKRVNGQVERVPSEYENDIWGRRPKIKFLEVSIPGREGKGREKERKREKKGYDEGLSVICPTIQIVFDYAAISPGLTITTDN